MSVHNLHSNKITSFWAFLIGLLTAFGLMFFVWLILYKEWFVDKSESGCGCGYTTTSVNSDSANRYCHAKKYSKCNARRHRHSFHRTTHHSHRFKF